MKHKVQLVPSVVAFLSSKGGVGKTTTAVNVAVAIARTGRSVTLIDTDPQANASRFFPPSTPTLRELLQRVAPLSKARVLVRDNLALVSSTRALDNTPLVAWAQLAPVCEQLTRMGDVVIIDTPAGWRTETRAVAACASLCVVPVVPEMLVYEAAMETLDLLQCISPPPPIWLLRTLWRENRISRLLSAQRGDWLQTVVPRRESVNVRALHSQSVFDGASNPLAPVFENLAVELGEKYVEKSC